MPTPRRTSILSAHTPLLALALVAVLLPGVSAPPTVTDQATDQVSAATAPAAARMPTLRATRRVATGVVLRGRTKPRRARLAIQRWHPTRKRWVPATRLRSRRHRYRAVVPHRTRVTWYRTRNRGNGRLSRRIRVRPARDACGIRPRKGRRLWKCSMVDRFNGTSLNTSRWKQQMEGFWSGTEDWKACYVGKNVRVRNGRLQLWLRKQEYDCPGLDGERTQFTAGMVSTYHRFSQRYGRFEARVRNTASTKPGLHEAFWLWPDNRYVEVNWPQTGEIDVSETYSVHPYFTYPYLHYGDDHNKNNTAVCLAYRGKWNRYLLVWKRNRISIYVNGRHCLTNRSGDPAFRKRFIVAFTQAVGSAENAFDPANPPRLPAVYEVDWVRVWR